MVVYILNFVANMLLGLLMVPSQMTTINERNYKQKKKLYLLITFLQFGLVAGFRSITVGYDTGSYKEIFDVAPNTCATIFTNPKPIIEPGFMFLCALIKTLGGGYQVLLLASSLFIMGGVCIFIYRHSKNVVLSVFILISFPYYYSSFDIIRHYICTTFILLGYKYAINRKFLVYLLFVFLGSFFHTSAWVFLLLYFFTNVKWNVVTVFISVIVAALCYFFIEDIFIWLTNIIGKSNGIESGWVGSYGGGLRTALMYLALFGACLLMYINIAKKRQEDATALFIMLVMFFVSVVFINARMMTRIIMFGGSLMSIAIPQLSNAILVKNEKYHKLLILAIVCVGIFYHAFMLITNWQNIIPYIPFWKV